MEKVKYCSCLAFFIICIRNGAFILDKRTLNLPKVSQANKIMACETFLYNFNKMIPGLPPRTKCPSAGILLPLLSRKR